MVKEQFVPKKNSMTLFQNFSLQTWPWHKWPLCEYCVLNTLIAYAAVSVFSSHWVWLIDANKDLSLWKFAQPPSVTPHQRSVWEEGSSSTSIKVHLPLWGLRQKHQAFPVSSPILNIDSTVPPISHSIHSSREVNDTEPEWQVESCVSLGLTGSSMSTHETVFKCLSNFCSTANKSNVQKFWEVIT